MINNCDFCYVNFQGAICQGQSEASVLASYMTTNLNSMAGKRAIGRTLLTYKTQKEQDVFSLIGMHQPDMSDPDHSKYVCRMLNRLMMLSIPAQEVFFERVTQELARMSDKDSIFSDTSGIGEL